MAKTICAVHILGVIDYQRAWDLQNRFAAEIGAGDRQPTLLLLEHPHTYTFGRRGDAVNLLWDEAELDRRGVAVYWVDRGGDVTYHGPGQLVGYPLIPLGVPSLNTEDKNRIPQVDYIGYIRKLEQVIIAAVAEFGVKSRQVEGLTGVWVNREQFTSVSNPSLVSHQQSATNPQPSIAKLAAIGVKVDSRGITRHGFALNVDPDMDYWEGIVGCGLEYPEISLAQILKSVPKMRTIIETIVQAFSQIFHYQIDYRAINLQETNDL